MSEQCDKCRFWYPEGTPNERGLGECWRYPPDGEYRRGRTYTTAWCGEFAAVLADIESLGKVVPRRS